MPPRLRNGRFVKRKTAEKINRALASMSDAKKKEVRATLDEIIQSEIPDEHSIVSLRELAKNLKCTNCRSLLDMEKLSDFEREGLHSKFRIKCDNCTECNSVNTGVTRNKVSDINASVILGAIHAGVGNTSLNKILACGNLPCINDHLYKKYESIILNTPCPQFAKLT